MLPFVCFWLCFEWLAVPSCSCADQEQCVGGSLAADSHWDYWISRQCGLLDSVPVATVRAGTKAGQAWLVLPWQCWGDSEWSYASPQCHNKHLFPEVLLGGYSTNSISPSPHSHGFWCVPQEESALGASV